MTARKNQKKIFKQAKAALTLKQAKAAKSLTSAATAMLPFGPRWFEYVRFCASIAALEMTLLSMLEMLMFRSLRLGRALRAGEFLTEPVPIWVFYLRCWSAAAIRPRHRGRHW